MTSAEDRPEVRQLRETVWEMLAPGFTSRADVIEWAREDAESDDEVRVTADESEAVVRELWDRRLAELAARPGPGDEAKLDRAYVELAERGFVVEMNCGVDQADADDLCRSRAENEGRTAFVYFHEQDAERLAHPGATLYLGFDAVAPKRRFRKRAFESQRAYDDAAFEVGRTIVEALQRAGLAVEWNGSPGARPFIRDIDWRRPLPPD